MKPAATLNLAALVCNGVMTHLSLAHGSFLCGSVRALRVGAFKVLAHSRCKRQNTGAPKMSTP